MGGHTVGRDLIAVLDISEQKDKEESYYINSCATHDLSTFLFLKAN